MGARAMSPGGALLRGSRLFSVPKPLPEPPTNSKLLQAKSATMTKTYPQYQAITSPLSSREKGDWGLKRPFPIKTTMATSTPLIRIKEVDTVESVTDFTSAADHSLSLEKFQEMRVVMSLPRSASASERPEVFDTFVTSVFEEDSDFTHVEEGKRTDRRWKFRGPWLAKMTEGELTQYMQRIVRPNRAAFRQLLKNRMAEEMTARQNAAAVEEGKPAPRKVEARFITEAQFLEYLHSLRKDRITLYALVSQFLDLAPLSEPSVGFVNSFTTFLGKRDKAQSPYGKAGPPLTHPSAGISYLRTPSIMDNHPVYGPQAKQTPVQARILYPRVGSHSAKLGVGGFVSNSPPGDNEFNSWKSRYKLSNKQNLTGIRFLDTTTPGGAKCYIEPRSATVDPSGRVVLKVFETTAEAQLIAKENQGKAKIYNDAPMQRNVPAPASTPREEQRMDRVAEELLKASEEPEAQQQEKEVLGSSSSYGLGESLDNRQP